MKLTEHPNLEALSGIVDSKYIYERDRARLKKYLAAANSHDGKVEVNYEQTSYNGKCYGRYFAQHKGMLVCQPQWNAIKSELYSDREMDIDIVNCIPTILLDLCKRHSIKCGHLDNYVSDREGFFSQMNVTDDDVNRYNLEKVDNMSKYDFCKKIVIAKMFGMGLPAMKKTLFLVNDPFPSKSFGAEIKRITNSIIELQRFSKIVSDIRVAKKMDGEEASKGGILAIILQDIESSIVSSAIADFQEAGITVTASTFDGFQVLSKDIDHVTSLLDEINEKIPVRFIIKPWKRKLSDITDDIPELGIEIPDDNGDIELGEVPETKGLDPIAFNGIKFPRPDGTSSKKEILTKKAYFEKHAAMITGANVMVHRTMNGEWRLVKSCSVKNVMANLRIISKTRDGIKSVPFFDIWLTMPDRRQYSGTYWRPWTTHPAPPIPEGDDGLNTFNGLRHDYDPNFKYDPEKIAPWLKHVEEVLARGEAKSYEYFINWLAHIIQRPYQKTGVNVLIGSAREGAGKNALIDFIQTKVIGTRHSRQLTMDGLMNNFNADAEYCVLTVLDEMQGKGAAFKNHCALKDFTTRLLMSVERKGVDRFISRDYNNMIFTTNELLWIVKLSISDRRNFMMSCSSKYICNQSYFDSLREYDTDEVGLHFFHFLANRDISKFNVRDIPITDWKRELMDMSIDPSFKVLLELWKESRGTVNERFIEVQDIMARYNECCKERDRVKSAKSMNTMWGDYTTWSPTKDRRTRRVGFAYTADTLLQTMRSVRRDPEYEPYIEEDEEGNEVCLV